MIDFSAFCNDIKNIIKSVLNSEKYTTVTYGIVVSTEPLIIRLTENAKIELSSDFLIIPKEFTEKTFDTATNGMYAHNHKIVIDNSIKVGDKLILIRQWGGQKYLVVGRC